MDEESESEMPSNLLAIEAREAIKDVSYAVSSVEVSSALPDSTDMVYMNLTTKEGDSFCVELSVQGFRVVGRQFDVVDEAVISGFFETIYSLLDHVSPQYRNTFGDTLAARLAQLQNQQAKEDVL